VGSIALPQAKQTCTENSNKHLNFSRSYSYGTEDSNLDVNRVILHWNGMQFLNLKTESCRHATCM